MAAEAEAAARQQLMADQLPLLAQHMVDLEERLGLQALVRILQMERSLTLVPQEEPVDLDPVVALDRQVLAPALEMLEAVVILEPQVTQVPLEPLAPVQLAAVLVGLAIREQQVTQELLALQVLVPQVATQARQVTQVQRERPGPLEPLVRERLAVVLA